jgi:hypothetical protein
MRNCLVVIIALMLITITLSPAIGFTFKTVGSKHSAEKSASIVDNSSVSGDYSFKSGDYSFKSGVPAHKLTPDAMANRHSFKASGVQSTRVPYSFKQGALVPYSIKLVGVDNANQLGKQEKKEAILLGSLNKLTKIEAVEAIPVASNATSMSENNTPLLPANLMPQEAVNLTK